MSFLFFKYQKNLLILVDKEKEEAYNDSKQLNICSTIRRKYG